MIENRILSMNKSPFHDDELFNSKGEKRKTIRLPSEAYEQLETYFEANNLDFSKGIRSLCYEKLDTICDERKTFNNLEVFMLIPKTNNNDELIDKCQIIAIVNTDCDFRSDFNHLRKFDDDYNLVYVVNDFEGKNFPMHILQYTKESCVYRTNKNDLNSFHTFKDRQRELYYDNRFNDIEDSLNLNVDDCYFVRFPLNNYLDVFRNGQYQSESFSNSHEGVYIFTDEKGVFKSYCFIIWNYSNEMNNLAFEVYFSSEAFFIDEVYKTKDERLIKSALNVIDGKYSRKRLEDYKQSLLDEIDYLNRMLEDNP